MHQYPRQVSSPTGGPSMLRAVWLGNPYLFHIPLITARVTRASQKEQKKKLNATHEKSTLGIAVATAVRHHKAHPLHKKCKQCDDLGSHVAKIGRTWTVVAGPL